jgi:cytochrome P450
MTSPFCNVLDPELFAEGLPLELLRELSSAGSVLWIDDPLTKVPYWLVTRREELDFVERNKDLFSSQARSAMPMEDPQDMVDNVSAKMLINMDEPRHMKMRQIVRHAFSPGAVAEILPFLKTRAKQVVDAIAHRGQCEFVKDVAAELPLLTICYLMEVPAENRQQVFDWTNTMMFIQDPDASEGQDAALEASMQLMQYALSLKQGLTQASANTVTGRLASGEIDGEPISDEDFMWMFLMVITAGNETTRSGIAQGMRLLMEHPDQLRWLQDNLDKIPDAVDEMLRFNGPLISMRRTVMADVQVGSAQMKKGDKVVLHYPTVNFDEQVFGADAHQFDVTRAARHPTLARDLRSFGTGSHYCLGTHLAKQEMQIMFAELLPRIRQPKFAGPVKYMRSYFLSSIREMPITFESI